MRAGDRSDAPRSPDAADRPIAYLANDRRRALAQGRELPERTSGAGLFADISGFVATSAQLAAEYGPQRGAEELTALLDAAIGAAIDEVSREGGSVVYFSGDAITCWFDGPAGAEQASRAALAAVLAVDSVGQATTPSGRAIALRLKCAVAAGPVRRFVVGNPSIQLIDVLAGSLLDELAAVEASAHPGEVLLAESALAVLGDRAQCAERRALGTQRNQSAGVLTHISDDSASPSPDVVDDGLIELAADTVRPWLLPVVFERLQAGRGDFVAELRTAVPVFIRFPGFDFDGDERAPAGLDEFVRLTQEVFAAHGGNVLQLTLGDKGAYLYAMLGSPVAHGDDPARAVAAAAELLTAARQLGVDDVQIGLTYGRVRSGTYGHSGRRTFVCLGPPVNLAARLMSTADNGRIQASADLVAEAGPQFRWESLGLRDVKGFDDSVEVFRFDGFDTDHGTRDSLFVGRTDELAALVGALDRAEAGLGTVLAVQGEPGNGKSRLVREFTARATDRSARVAIGEAATSNRRGSFLIWRPVIRAVLGASSSSGPESLLTALTALLPDHVERFPLLGPVLGLDLPDTPVTASMDAKLAKASREDLVITLVRSVARDTPTVLVLEDVDRADPLSRDLIEAVAGATVDEAVAVVLTFRPAEEEAAGLAVTEHPGFRTLPIPALDGDTAEALLIGCLRSSFGSTIEPAPGLVADVRDRSQGNPFYIEHLVGYLASASVDPSDDSDTALWRRLELPGALHSLVLERLDTLAEHPRRTVKVASIIGRHFDRDLVLQAYPDLGDEEDTETSLRAAQRVELIARDHDGPRRFSPWHFPHNLVQEVSYESVPHELRTSLHAQVAAALEQRHPDPRGVELDLLTHHWWHSDNAPKKVDYLTRAAAAARASYANETALEYHRRLASLQSGSERAATLRDIGQVLELTGEWDAARAAYTESMDLSGDDLGLRAWCECQLADVARRQGRFDEAADHLERAERGFARVGDEAGRAQAFHLRGTLAAQQGHYVQARESYETSLGLRPEGADDRARAATLSNLGVVAEYEGDLAGARVHHEQSLALRERLGDLWAIAVSRTGLGMISMLEHRPREAREQFQEAMRLNLVVGDAWMVAISHNNLGNADRDLANYDDALRHYAQAGARYVASADLWSLAFLLEDAAICRAEQDDGQAAAALLGAADACRTTLGSPRPDSLEQEIAARLASVRDALGEPDWDTALRRGRGLSAAAAVALLA